MYSLKKNYINFFFDLVNQNYTFGFFVKSLYLISYISFSLPIDVFDSFNKKFFNYFLFLE